MGIWQGVAQRCQALLRWLFFLQYAPAAWVYAWQRDRNERRFLPKLDPTLRVPGQLVKAVPAPRGAHLVFEQATLDVDFLAADLISLTWQPGLLPVPYALAQTEWPAVETQIKPSEEGWVVSSEALRVTVGPDGALTLRDQHGTLLRQEAPPQWQGEGWTHRAALPTEACIYGLGERVVGLNLRAACDRTGQPKVFHFWNSDPSNIRQVGADPLYITMPVYLGLHTGGSYLVFYENSFGGEMQFGQEVVAQFPGGALRYYLAAGEPPQLLERFTQLTGRAPLPPRWALGYHQSRWGYRTEAVVRAEVKAFQTHDLPLSAVHLDIDCQVNHRSFTLDPQRFPNLCEFTRELSEAGVKLIAINNPGIKHSRHSNLFLEGQVLNAFCKYPDGQLVVAPVWPGQTVFPDFTNPRVRAWWSYQFAYLLDVGIAGFWNDMNEPAAFAAWGDLTLPLVAQHSLEGRGGDHREAHNLYGLLEGRAAFDGLRHHRPERRPLIVSRSGWVGMQRYAWTWTGDTLSTWHALQLTVGTVLGLGLSGVPFSGPDIGGFLGNPSAELYVRWFQMATFLPFYRTHCSTGVDPRAPWTYGEPTLSTIRHYLKLRYQLLPYLYTLAWETAQWGYPLARPLFWQDRANPDLWAVEDQFFLGDALLVCPVVQEGVRARSVVLPSGHWYAFHPEGPGAASPDHRRWDGNQTIELAAPLERMPLLVRAGTILPLEVPEAEVPTLALHLYPLPQGESHGHLYSDAGDGYGPSRLDRFTLSSQENQLTLTWEPSGEYPFPYAKLQVWLHGGTPQQAWVDGQPLALTGPSLECSPFQQVRFSGAF